MPTPITNVLFPPPFALMAGRLSGDRAVAAGECDGELPVALDHDIGVAVHARALDVQDRGLDPRCSDLDPVHGRLLRRLTPRLPLTGEEDRPEVAALESVGSPLGLRRLRI